jgi:hypothetical protein
MFIKAQRLKGIKAQRLMIDWFAIKPLSLYALKPYFAFVEFASYSTNLIYFLVSSITFELKKQIYFFLFPSDKKISFERFSIEIY